MRPATCNHVGNTILLSKNRRKTSRQFTAKVILNNMFLERFKKIMAI
jgi:hypothetical protein